MRTSALIPIALMDAANARLEFNPDEEPTGFGPGNFSVPLRSGTAEATHAGLSCGDVPGFLDMLLDMEATGDFPGLVVDYDGKPTGDTEAPSKADFGQMVKREALEWSDPSDWFDNPVMKGDRRTRDGKTWESTMDYNVWQPGVSGWREIVAEGHPAWVQPTGAHDAYKLGETVTHKGKDWRNTGSDANVWEPGVFGWTEIK